MFDDDDDDNNNKSLFAYVFARKISTPNYKSESRHKYKHRKQQSHVKIKANTEIYKKQTSPTINAKKSKLTKK
jgi:hypothetical protein